MFWGGDLFFPLEGLLEIEGENTFPPYRKYPCSVKKEIKKYERT